MADTYNQRLSRANIFVSKVDDSFTSSNNTNATPEETITETDTEDTIFDEPKTKTQKPTMEKMSLSPTRPDRKPSSRLENQNEIDGNITNPIQTDEIRKTMNSGSSNRRTINSGSSKSRKSNKQSVSTERHTRNLTSEDSSRLKVPEDLKH